MEPNTTSPEDAELINRASLAHKRSLDRWVGSLETPRPDEVEELHGKRYVVLRDFGGVYAVFRIRADGQRLTRLSRYPKALIDREHTFLQPRKKTALKSLWDGVRSTLKRPLVDNWRKQGRVGAISNERAAKRPIKPNTVIADDATLTKRAYIAYVNRTRFISYSPAQPSSVGSGVEEYEGKRYVVLRNTRGVLAAYRVQKNGRLKWVNRFPRALET